MVTTNLLDCSPFKVANLHAKIKSAAPVGPSSPSKKLMIMKFGGSSIKDADRVRHVADLIRQRLPSKPVVVLSAMGRTTNSLVAAGQLALSEGKVEMKEIEELHLDAAKTLGLGTQAVEDIQHHLSEVAAILRGICLLKEMSPRTTDMLMSYGERLSCRVVAAYLDTLGCPAKAVDSWDIGIKTTAGSGSGDSNKSNAEVIPEAVDEIENHFKALRNDYKFTPIITGFIAKDVEGNVTTLGRGGSDFTAALIGAAISASEIHIWTDVDGVLTTDPRVVPDAVNVPVVSFEEASELAYFGAKVLHPMTILPAMNSGIPVRVLNSYNEAHPGTLIVNDAPARDSLCPVTAITYQKGVFLVEIVSARMLAQSGFLARVFSIFDSLKICVDVIATSEVSISLTIDKDIPWSQVEKMKEALSNVAEVKVAPNKAILTIVGDHLRSTVILGMACVLFSDEGIPIDVVSCGASKVNVSFVLPQEYVEKALGTLHHKFFHDYKKLRKTSAQLSVCA